MDDERLAHNASGSGVDPPPTDRLEYGSKIEDRAQIAVVVKHSESLAGKLATLSSGMRELGALYEEITIFKRHFNTIHSTLQDAEALCAKLGQAPSFVYFDAPSFNQIVGKVSNALMDCILYCGGLDNDWIRGREPQTDLMKYFEDRFRDYNARLRYFQKPLELDLISPLLAYLKHHGPINVSATGIHVSKLRNEEEKQRSSQTAVKSLPIPEAIRTAFDKQGYGDESSFDLVQSAHQVVRLLDEIQRLLDDDELSVQGHAKLLKCIYNFEIMEKNLASNPPPESSHWPSYINSLKQALDTQYGRVEGRYSDTSPKLDLSILIPEISAELGLKLGSLSNEGPSVETNTKQLYSGPLRDFNDGVYTARQTIRLFRLEGPEAKTFRITIRTGLRKVEVVDFDLKRESTKVEPVFELNRMGPGLLLHNHGRVTSIPLPTMVETMRFLHALTGYKPWDSYYDQEVLVEFTEGPNHKVTDIGCLQLWFYNPVDSPVLPDTDKLSPQFRARNKAKLVIFTKATFFSFITIDIDDTTVLSTQHCSCGQASERGNPCKSISIERRKAKLLDYFGTTKFDARRYKGDWNIARILRDDTSTNWPNLTRISLTFVTAERRAKFTGRPDRCICDTKVQDPQTVRRCFKMRHQGLFGELQAYELRHRPKYSLVKSLLEETAFRVEPKVGIRVAVVKEDSDGNTPKRERWSLPPNREIDMSIAELMDACTVDGRMIERLRAGYKLTPSEETDCRRSFSITDDVVRRLTDLLASMKTGSIKATGGPWASHDDDEPSQLPAMSRPRTTSHGGHLPSGLWQQKMNEQMALVEEALDKATRVCTMRQRIMDLSATSGYLLLTDAHKMTLDVISILQRVQASPDIGEGTIETSGYPGATSEPETEYDKPPETVADISHAAVSSIGDSGYASRESASQATTKNASAAVEVVEDEDDNDNETLYSVDSVLPKSRDAYIDEFSRRLAEDIRHLSALAHHSGPTFPSSLLGLLKSFARRLHGESLSQTEREISVFLHKHRTTITDALGLISLSDHAEDDDDYDSEDDEAIAVPFKKPETDVNQWIASLLPSHTQDTKDHKEAPPTSQDPETDAFQTTVEYLLSAGVEPFPEYADELEEDHTISGELARVTEYQKFVKQSAAYHWLLSMIKGSWRLNVPGPSNAMAGISETISSRLLSHPTARKVSRRSKPVTIEMRISLDWDLRAFVKQQQYNVLRPEDVLDRAICLTGSWSEAHAMTPIEYLTQTWPSTYEPIYEIMKTFLSSDTNACDYESPGHYLRCEQQGSSFTMLIKGKLDFVLETAEQLGWLASALRPSPHTDAVADCYPSITDLRVSKGKEKQSSDYLLSASCSMDFKFELAPDSKAPEDPKQGFCWSNMFRNPVLVSGYPIPQRSNPETGLEISLGFMSLLIDSPEVFQVAETRILKGFCSLLVAVEVTGDLVMWHLLFNSSGERISCFDSRLEGMDMSRAADLSLQDLESRRHVVGWCGDVKEYSGRPDANMSILSSNLQEPPKSFVIDKLYTEAGSYLIGGFAGSIGVRDKPIYLPREKSYSGLIDWVSSQPIIFFDVEDRRAWLIDGASALLHLVRASIKQDRTKPAYRSKWRFKGDLEGDDSLEGGCFAAIETLTSISNLNKALYLDDIRSVGNNQMEEVHYYFRDRVKEILHYLQVLVDHQARVAAQDGYWIRQSGKITKSVIGFDFWDIAKPPGPVRPRMYYLRTSGHGWIDYVHSIRATTLFGRNFGDLLKAGSPYDLCPEWRAVPKGGEYLGVSVSTLKAIHQARNESALAPGEITSDIVWSSRLELFSTCGCISSTPTKSGGIEQHSHHDDPVQLLLPKGRNLRLDIPKQHHSITLASLGDNGAVLFGHTPYRGLRKREDSKSQSTTAFADYGDSSIGPGMSSTTSTFSSSTRTRSGSNTTQGVSTEMTSISSGSASLKPHLDGLGRGSYEEQRPEKRSLLKRLGFKKGSK